MNPAAVVLGCRRSRRSCRARRNCISTSAGARPSVSRTTSPCIGRVPKTRWSSRTRSGGRARFRATAVVTPTARRTSRTRGSRRLSPVPRSAARTWEASRNPASTSTNLVRSRREVRALRTATSTSRNSSSSERSGRSIVLWTSSVERTENLQGGRSTRALASVVLPEPLGPLSTTRRRGDAMGTSGPKGLMRMNVAFPCRRC